MAKAILFRQLRPSEASKIAEIDRSEDITRGYFVQDGRLRSKSVSFYRSQGFRLAEEVHPGLYELAPDDIHMIKDL